MTTHSLTTFLVLSLLACGQDKNPGTGTETGADDPYVYVPTCDPDGEEVELDADPTWSDGIGQLVADRCTGCHVDGGIGPFPLDSYEAASPMAAAMASATGDRRMPPFMPSNCGDCQTYREARALTDEEIAMIAAWSAAGAPEGEAASFDPAATPTLTSEDAVLDPGEDFTPDEAITDSYRCMLVDAPSDTDTYVTGYHIFPGGTGVVHHVVLYAPDSDEDAADAEALDEDEDGLGYTCFGGAKVTATPVAIFAPGAGATNFPDGVGIPLAGGRKLIMQMHYNTSHGTEPDRTTIGLSLSDDVDYPGLFTRISNSDIELPPGEVSTVTMDVEAPNQQEALLRGVIPHMHETGVTLQASAINGGDETCLVDVPDWDFHWQGLFLYEDAVSIEPGSTIRLTCTYDTAGRTETTTFGEGTLDEMCMVFALVTGA